MNKFFQLLNTLDTFERIRLRKFSVSPYFSENKWFEKLVANVLNSPESSEKQLFEAVFPDKAFDAQRYNRLLSDSTALLLKFLEIETYLADNSPLTRAPTLLHAFQNKQLHRLYEATDRQLRIDLQEQPIRNSQFYAQQLSLEKELLAQSKNERKRTDRNNLEAVHHSLDCFFILEKLRYTCGVINVQNVLQHAYQIEGIVPLVAWLQDSTYLNEPSIAVYWQVYQLLITQQPESFDTLKMLLNKHEACFDSTELRELYTYCINYCIRQVNNGNEQFLHEYLEIIWRLLENKVLFVSNELPVADYKNTVTIGLRLGEFDKIEHFVKTYSQYLPLEYHATAITFNLAKLHFAKADYQAVISFLQEMDYESVFYALDSRWLLIKTYYMLKEELALESAMRAFRVYLLRNKTISTYTKQQYLQLIILLNKILLLPRKDKAYAEKLRIMIEQKTIIADKRWFIELLNEL